MAKLIRAATLVRYNANVRGNNVGDCVCRSMSFAFDIPYSKLGKLLNASMKAKRKTHWNIPSVYEPVIQQLGGSDRLDPRIDNETGEVLTEKFTTVDEFADSHPTGCYLVLCGRNQNNDASDHLVCIIDDTIYDSWDCRKTYAKYFYTCSPERHVSQSNLENDIGSLAEDACDLADEEIERYTKKWVHDGERCKVGPIKHNVQAVVEGYTIKMSCRYSYWIKDEVYEEDYSIRFPMNIVLKPGMSSEDAREFMVKTTKQRVYDRMYKVRDTIRENIDEFEAKYAEDADTADQGRLFLTTQERRFVNQLPGKIRPYITYVYIYQPGQHPDSYTVKLKRLPGDDGDPFVRFEAYESRGIQEMIKRYAKTFERPWDDYDPEYEGYV